jgi:hypothetical protein
MKKLFRAYFHPKNFQKKVGRKFIKVRIRIRNRIRIRTFSKVGSGSGQKSSESATLRNGSVPVPDAPDTELAGYPANLKASYRYRYRISGSS